MLSISKGCTYKKIIKILLAISCILFYFEYIIISRRKFTFYAKVNQSQRDKISILTNQNISSAHYSEEIDLKYDIQKREPITKIMYNFTQKISDANSSTKLQIMNSYVSSKESQNKTNFLQKNNVLNKLLGKDRKASVILKQGHNVYCPNIPPGLNGPIKLNLTKISLKSIEYTSLGVGPGGHYIPKNCKPNDKVAIVVPYRDREAHLAIFLNNIHTFLIKQLIEYQIYIVEQKGHEKFNRASLMNVGFVEAMRQYDWDCFVFHDVDLLPLDDRNLYTCPSQPRHLSAAIDKFHYRLPYAEYFGGVSALTTEQFQKVNGFSNKFWGWGGEDDDMANRINHFNYDVLRNPPNIARYKMLKHHKEIPNPERTNVLEKGQTIYSAEGLNTLHYTLIEIQVYQLYTLLSVELKQPSSRYLYNIEFIHTLNSSQNND